MGLSFLDDENKDITNLLQKNNVIIGAGSGNMKVLFISHYTNMYGANRSLYELIIKLKEEYNIQPIVLTPNKGVFNEELDKIGVENFCEKFLFWYSYKENKLKVFLKKLRVYILNKICVLKINNFIKNKNINIDIIHTNSSVINIGAELAKKMNIPHIWHIREFGEEDYNLYCFLPIDKQIRYMEKRSDKLIFISKILEDKYKSYIKDINKSKVIYNGVDIKEYYYSKKNNHNKKIIISGKISENKNQLEVIKAINYIKNKYNYTNLELYIVGEGDFKYMDKLRSYVIKNNLFNVIFTGYTKNIMDIQKNMDIGVISSYKEAFGRVTVEYMLSGLAIVASKAGANEEIIISKKTGMLYELNNYEDLGEKLYELCTNEKLLKNLSKKGQEYALSNFTSDINSKNIFNLYKEIIGGTISE